jgi:4-diphosphocytidyl-2-C-methyl-D-erythritol kinase
VIEIDAPAKVNLGLRIRGRRADGYHLLESLFVPLDLADRLSVRIQRVLGGASARDRVALTVHGERAAGVPTDGSNLAARAAAAFLEAAGQQDLAVEIRLEKRVPSLAGLGGGSSDAGGVLRALAALLPGAISREALAGLALRLGADVPFFLDPRPAMVRGVGEQIEPVSGLPSLVLLLVHPGMGLSTAAVYAAFDALAAALTPPSPGPTVMRPEGPLEPEVLARLLVNDLEPAALRLCPPISRLRLQLFDAGALAVGMSGSGPTLFGVFPDETSARSAAAKFGTETLGREAGRVNGRRSSPPIWTWVARTANAPQPELPLSSERRRTDGASPNW